MSLSSEIYEPETTNFILSHLVSGDNALVCGAHQGYFACLMSDIVGERGTVFAFEPENTNFSILSEKVREKKNVKTFNFALGIKECTATLFVNSDNDGGHALWDVSIHQKNEKTKQEKKTQETKVKILDDVLEGVTALKFMLLDAEGAELAILKGGINIITDCEVPYIICEINGDALNMCGASQMALRSFLHTYGYKDYLLIGNEIKPATEGKEHFVSDKEGQEYVFNMLFSLNGVK